MKRARGVAAIALLCGGSVVRAEEVLELGLDDAVERAVAASARIAAFDAERDAAAFRVEGARGNRKPRVDVIAQYMRISPVPEFPILLPSGEERTIFPSLEDYGTAGIRATLPLYAGGGTEARIEAARLAETAAGHRIDDATADVVLETRIAYWSVVVARDTERVLTEALVAYEAHLRDARNRLELGFAARNEVLAVEVDRDRAELSRVRAAGTAQSAEAVLARLIDVVPGTRIVPTEALLPLPETTAELEELVARALAARPERAELAARAAAAEVAVDIARADRRPAVDVAAGWDYARPNPRVLPPQDEWNDTWDVGIALRWTVYDGGRTPSAVAARRSEATALERRVADLDRSIRLEVTARRVDLVTAGAAIPVTETAIESARENVRVAGDRYRAGASPSSELLDAENVLLRAELDRVEALARVHVAGAELDRAVGD